MKHKIKGIIEHNTVVMPLVIADSVVYELEYWSGISLPFRESLIEKLADKADLLYSKRIKPIYQRNETKLRDYLYCFMRHWLTAELHGYINHQRIPYEFANGQKLRV